MGKRKKGVVRVPEEPAMPMPASAASQQDESPVSLARGRRSTTAFVAIVGLLLAACVGAAWLIPHSREGELATASFETLAARARANPNDALACYYYGRALLQRNQPADAQGLFQRAVSLNPRLGRAYLGLARSQALQGHLRDAELAFHEAVTQDPSNLEARVLLARLYYDNGRPAEALRELQLAAQRSPDSAEVWFALSHVYGGMGKRDQVLDALEKCTRLDPGRAEYWRALGRVYWHYSRLAEAESALRQALRIQPADGVCQLWLGEALMQGAPSPETLREAEACFRKAVALQPGNGEASLALGKLLARQRDHAEAEKWLRSAVRLAPSNDQAQFQLGQFLRANGKEREAAQYLAEAGRLSAGRLVVKRLEAALAVHPADAPLRLRLARLYRKYANGPAAMGEYQRYLALRPSDAVANREMESCRAQLASAFRPEPPAGGATDAP